MSKSTSGLHDPYEDQLAAARYRAERDALAQAMQRVADSMREHALGVEGMGDSPVSGWERELRAALGGLESIGTMIEYRRVLNGVCKRLGLTDGTGMPEQDGVIYEALGRRLMPEGCEWPRYESGEPVRFGDWFSVTAHDEDGDFELTMAAESVSFDGHGVMISDSRHVVKLLIGERVKRPAVLASDDDGCCDPGTYRCQEAAFTCDSCGHTVFVDKCMVEEIRYLRAKGIRTLNCCCGHDGKAEPFIIVNEGDECRMLNMGYERHVNEHGVTYFTPKSSCPPKDLTHTKPEPIDTWERIEVTGPDRRLR